jgi:hypothetical protein
LIAASALALVAVLVAGMSLYGVISPPRILAFARHFVVRPGIWAATAIRLLLAVLLWLSAPVCRTPLAFEVLAVIALGAAVALPLLGSARLLALLDKLASWPTLVVRIEGLVGIGFGIFLLWSLQPVFSA